MNTPLIIYLAGSPQALDTLYSYNAGTAIKITGYSILNPAGVAVELDIYKNGNLIDQISVTGTTYPNPGNFLPYYLDFGDILDIRVPTLPGSPLSGLTIIFSAEISSPADTSVTVETNQIQTPLLTLREGTLAASTTFFRFAPYQRIEIFHYNLSLRDAADQNVIINVKKNGNTVTQLLINANQTQQSGVIDVYFEIGEVLTFEVAQCGTGGAPGKSLLVALDYRNTTQTTFNSFQTPFVIPYEGLSSSQSNKILNSYSIPRDVTVVAVQLCTKAALAQDVLVSLSKNSQIVSNFSLTAGNTQTQPTDLNLSFVGGDVIDLAVVSPAALTNEVLLTIDYFIDIGDSSDTYTYYSDPQSDLVILARQVGFGAAKADTISFTNLLKYQRDVDNVLNGRLRARYRTPLRKVSFGNNPWPGAIQLIAQRMVLRYLLNDVFSEVEPNASQNIINQANLANEDLELILTKQIVLEGQALRSKNAGSNAYTEPLQEPQAPPQVMVAPPPT